MISLFAFTSVLLASNMTEQARFQIGSSYSIPYEFTGSSSTIDIYYTSPGTPSNNPFIQIMKNDELEVSHLMNFEDDLYIDTGTRNYNIYKYSFDIGTIYHTDTFEFYLSWNDTPYLGGSNFTFDIVFNFSEDSYNNSSYDNGYSDGYLVGKVEGYNEGVSDSEENVLGNALLSIADIPFKILNDFIGFEVFGFNVVTFITGILGILVVAFIIKLLI